MVLSCGEKHHNNDGSDHGVTKMLVIITTTIKSLSWSSSVLRQETRQERDQVVPIEENAPVHGKSPANAEKAEALNKDGSRLVTRDYVLFVKLHHVCYDDVSNIISMIA